jgi:cation:H+ antiporter
MLFIVIKKTCVCAGSACAKIASEALAWRYSMVGLLLVAGLVVLWLGGEAFVYGSVAIANRLNVPKLVIGLTLVGFGTSLPELVTSLTAAMSGAPGLAVGNVVGSNIANALLILGVAAMIAPVACRPDGFYRDILALAVATAVGTALILHGQITRLAGIMLSLGIAAYVGLVYYQERGRHSAAGDILTAEAQVISPLPYALAFAGAMAVCGLAAVLGGAWLLVTAAIELAAQWHVSSTLIGLTIVAVGTSLPELAITVVASMRGQSDVALGNIMGSNIFNLLAILGLTAVVHPIVVPDEIGAFDVTVMSAATILILAAAATRTKLVNRQGIAMLLAYLGYAVIRARLLT